MDNKKKFDFKFSFRICCKNPDELSASLIVSSLNSLNIPLLKIAACYQYQTNKSWIVGLDAEKFVTDEDFKVYNDMLYNCVNIYGNQYVLEDPNKVVSYLRIGWLPHQINHEGICDQLKEMTGAEMVFALDEYYKETELMEIKNGNKLFIIVEGKKEKMEKIEFGIQLFDGYYGFINRLGVKPQCLLCKQVGHIKKNCPQRKLKCGKCNGEGHATNACSYAIASQKNRILPILHAPENEMDGVISTESLQKQFLQEREENEKKKNKELLKKQKENNEQKNKSKQEQKNNEISKPTSSNANVVKNNQVKRRVSEIRDDDYATPSPENKTLKGGGSLSTAKGGTNSSDDSLITVGDD